MLFSVLKNSIFLMMIQIGPGLSFNYINTSSWGGLCQTGKMQSPINIERTLSVSSVACRSLIYHGYSKKAQSMLLQNDGNTVSISGHWSSIDHPRIIASTDMVSGTYTFFRFIFHWGEGPTNGTEHKYNGKGAAVEGQAWHINSKYSNLSEAVQHDDGILIISLRYEEDPKRNATFLSLINGIPKIRKPKSITTIEPISLDEVGLTYGNVYYFYEGSFTIPPCYENVKWLLKTNSLPIATKTLRMLWTIGLEGQSTNNVRPIQNLNNRAVLIANCKNDLL